MESRLINLDYQICDIEYNEFYLKDHLGNTRIRFADKDGDKKFTLAKNDNCLNEVFGSNHYYPFGMETEGPWLSASYGMGYSIAKSKDGDDIYSLCKSLSDKCIKSNCLNYDFDNLKMGYDFINL